ncbi:MAG: ParB/RepB/Spo0J family partition protein [Dysgonomonas sp.]
MAELSQSIKNIGLLQAITLRLVDDKYQIVCGERRYRAFLLNNETHIPATIRQYTDDQVMEIALAENLNRKDLSAIEEANGFQYFLNTNRYKLEGLVSIFGKSEAYIRGRLRLLNLIDEYQGLLDNDTMTISMGLELAKYSKAIQKEVYDDHFVKDDSSNWKDLGTKDFAGRLQRMYTMDLSNYSFDKTECRTCPHNTDSYSLFIQSESGKCTNAECLKKKRAKYTLDCCKALTDSDADITVCISPLDKLNEEINSNLQQDGIDIKTVITQEYPELPTKPEKESYATDAAYKEAMEEYRIEKMAFHAELDEIEHKVETGQYKKYIYIGDNNPKFCYANVEQDKTVDPVKELEEQDFKNKELAIKNICKEALELLSTKEIPLSDFSLFEDELFLYFMLNYLKPKHYHLFGISNQNSLSERDKEGIIKGITGQQRTLLFREVIISHFMNIRDYSSKHKSSFLLTEFVKRLLPQEMNVIITKYMDTYQKASERINRKVEKYSKYTSQ